MYQIFIVEDQPAIQESLRDFVESEADMDVCGTATTGADALERVPQLTPDLTLVDISLPDMNGFDLIKALLASNPMLPTLIVSGHSIEHYQALAVRAGARGYVDKLKADLTLIPTIRDVLNRR